MCNICIYFLFMFVSDNMEKRKEGSEKMEERKEEREEGRGGRRRKGYFPHQESIAK